MSEMATCRYCGELVAVSPIMPIGVEPGILPCPACLLRCVWRSHQEGHCLRQGHEWPRALQGAHCRMGATDAGTAH